MRSSVGTANAGRAEEDQAHGDAQLHSPAFASLRIFAADQVALERADVGDVEPAVEVIGLVQEGARQQVLAGHLEELALDVLRAHGDALGAPHLLAEAGNAEAAFLALLLAFHLDDLRVDEDQLRRRVLAVGRIDHRDLPAEMPICGAASPTPLAAYIDSNMSSINLCSSGVSNSVTVFGFAAPAPGRRISQSDRS